MMNDAFREASFLQAWVFSPFSNQWYTVGMFYLVTCLISDREKVTMNRKSKQSSICPQVSGHEIRVFILAVNES